MAYDPDEDANDPREFYCEECEAEFEDDCECAPDEAYLRRWESTN